MTLSTLYTDLIDQIVSDLKTISALADDAGGTWVSKWKTPHRVIQGKVEAVVMAGPMEPIEGFTTKGSYNYFDIIVDLLGYSSAYDDGFDTVMGVAQEIYDKFHLTNISGLVRVAKVSLYPGDGQISQRNLLAIPIRVIIRCEKTIIQ